MSTPEEVEKEMMIRESIRKHREMADTNEEMLKVVSETQRGYYGGLIDAGFSPQQALWLCGQYHPLNHR